jgi:flagellar hook-length control protein FliK
VDAALLLDGALTPVADEVVLADDMDPAVAEWLTLAQPVPPSDPMEPAINLPMAGMRGDAATPAVQGLDLSALVGLMPSPAQAVVQGLTQGGTSVGSNALSAGTYGAGDRAGVTGPMSALARDGAGLPAAASSVAAVAAGGVPGLLGELAAGLPPSGRWTPAQLVNAAQGGAAASAVQPTSALVDALALPGQAGGGFASVLAGTLAGAALDDATGQGGSVIGGVMGAGGDILSSVGAFNLPSARVSDGALPLAVTLHTPVTAPEFKQALGVQVSLLARDGVQQASLHLNPADMGPISVQIALEGSQARVDFGVASAATRQMIEAGLPELASSLREAGFTLTGGGVSQQSQGREGSDRPAGGGTGPNAQATPDDGAELTARARVVQVAAPGRLDLYA